MYRSAANLSRNIHTWALFLAYNREMTDKTVEDTPLTASDEPGGIGGTKAELLRTLHGHPAQDYALGDVLGYGTKSQRERERHEHAWPPRPFLDTELSNEHSDYWRQRWAAEAHEREKAKSL